MNCNDFRPLIYTYAELETKERNLVDAHVQNCRQCHELFNEANEMHTMVSLLAEHKALPANAAKLTNKIMAEINKPGKTSLRDSISLILSGNIARYSLSTLSCALLLILLIEVLPTKPATDSSMTNTQSGSVILNSKAFRESFQKKKSNAPHINDCRSPFRTSLSMVDCMKSKIK